MQHGEYVSLAKIETALLNCPLIDNICVYATSLAPYCVALVIPNKKHLEEIGKQVRSCFSACLTFWGCAHVKFAAHFANALFISIHNFVMRNWHPDKWTANGILRYLNIIFIWKSRLKKIYNVLPNLFISLRTLLFLLQWKFVIMQTISRFIGLSFESDEMSCLTSKKVSKKNSISVIAPRILSLAASMFIVAECGFFVDSLVQAPSGKTAFCHLCEILLCKAAPVSNMQRFNMCVTSAWCGHIRLEATLRKCARKGWVHETHAGARF